MSFVGLNQYNNYQNDQTDVKGIRADWFQMFQSVRFFPDQSNSYQIYLVYASTDNDNC